MWKNACLLTRLVSISVHAAEEAGNTIKKVMTSGDLKIVNKDLEGKTKDLQTEADRTAQAGIESKLKSAFGDGLQIVGEEELPEQLASSNFSIQNGLTEEMRQVLVQDKQVPSNLRDIDLQDVLVWVDPLDGTSEFVKAQKNPALLEQVTVLIGITHQGQPVAGVVHQPYHKDGARTIWGIQGVGTFGLELCKEKPSDGGLVAVTTASHSTQLVDDALTALQGLGLINSFRRVGGAGFKVLCCLEGAAAYVFASGGCKKWDTAAPEAVLRAAGGILTDVSGRRLQYQQNVQMQNSGGVLATAPWVKDHQAYISAIPQPVKEALPEKLGH